MDSRTELNLYTHRIQMEKLCVFKLLNISCSLSFCLSLTLLQTTLSPHLRQKMPIPVETGRLIAMAIDLSLFDSLTA